MNSQEEDEVWQVIIGARVEVSKESGILYASSCLLVVSNQSVFSKSAILSKSFKCA